MHAASRTSIVGIIGLKLNSSIQIAYGQNKVLLTISEDKHRNEPSDLCKLSQDRNSAQLVQVVTIQQWNNRLERLRGHCLP